MKRWIVCMLALVLCIGALGPRALAEEETPETAIVDPYRLYTYEQLMADLDALAARYPELVTVGSIGQSVEEREIPLLTVGKGDRDVVLCAAMHGREYETTNYLMYTMEQYCRAYEAGEWYYGLSYRALLDGVRFVVVPMLNPDGVTIAQRGTEYALANEKLAAMLITDGWPGNYYCWKANANGVDLNRNWEYCFNNTWKFSFPCSADYAGPEPMSEPETRAMYALLANTPYDCFCSFHSAGNCVYWIDNTNSQELRDKLYPVASRVADFCGYYLMLNEDLSRGGGYMINQARAATEKPCMTVELGSYIGYYPYSDYGALANAIQRAYGIPLLLADEAMKMPEEPAATETAAEEPAAETVSEAPATEAPAALPAVRVTLDGAEIEFPDMRPVIENRRTLTPVRAVSEGAGLTVGWDGGVVTVTDGQRTVTLRVGEPVIDVDGEAAPLDCAPVLREGRTLVPIRAVLEPFGFAVDWDAAARTVVIASPAE